MPETWPEGPVARTDNATPVLYSKNLLRAGLALGLAASCVAPALAAAPAKVPPAPRDAITHHTLSLGGRTLAYTTTAGTITLKDAKGEPTARMFYTADTLDGVAPGKRAVTFFYNGGPGSSSVWLRMGSFGPVRVVLNDASANTPAPFRYVPNQYSLLDKTDLVFIDAPDTGYGRLLPAGKPTDFFGVDQDAAAFAQFIQTYVTTNNRWNSPKFLYGESYGTTRSAALVDYLQSNDDMAINGVVLQSSILDFNLDWTVNFMPLTYADGDWGYVLYLPSLAATAWYHHALPNRPANLRSFLNQVEQFASNEYTDALAKGATLSPSERQDVIRRLHEYTGLSEQFISDSNLRIQYSRFENALLRSSGKTVGRLDSRFVTDNPDPASDQPFWDPADVLMSPPFVATFEQYVRNDLHYASNVPYLPTNYGVVDQHWDFSHDGRSTTNVAPDLAEAMITNPHLHVFSANGYYDLATPYYATVYTLNHLNLSPSIQRNITFGFYESGHMIYLHPAALAALKSDLDRWYDNVLGSR